MEIGSEFWKKEKKYIQKSEELFLSGRTSLDIIVRDIQSEHEISSALLPSYCCHTMIEPFLKNNISVRFYDVFVNSKGELETKIPEPREHEVFYDMKYFGSNSIVRNNITDSNIRNFWNVIIEDTTHSCFHQGHVFTADYEYASCRKWMAFDGISIARKRQGDFCVKPNGWYTNESYCKRRNLAFALKEKYISGDLTDKTEYLKIFGETEEQLSSQYINFRPDLNTIIRYYIEMQNIDCIRDTRLKNARLLAEGLKDLKDIQLILDLSDSKMCPLFVPVIVEPEIRDKLRNNLIKKEIYCPVHWPISKMHTGISSQAEKIYKSELSLICDQRYGEREMLRIIDSIRGFFH